MLTEGVHSGDASGIVASSFRIARILLDRLEDAQSGEIKLESLNADIPRQRIAQARAAAAVLGSIVSVRFPFAGQTSAVDEDLTELLINRTWRPALSTTGAGGLPAIANAGNVLRPGTQLQLSIRTPPTVDAERFRCETATGRSTHMVTGSFYGQRCVRLACAHASAVAPQSARRRITKLVRSRVHVHGRRGHNSVHGYAWRDLPARSIRDHGCSRARFKRARTE